MRKHFRIRTLGIISISISISIIRNNNTSMISWCSRKTIITNEEIVILMRILIMMT